VVGVGLQEWRVHSPNDCQQGQVVPEVGDRIIVNAVHDKRDVKRVDNAVVCVLTASLHAYFANTDRSKVT
jgi:hypothetical protein